MAPDTTAGCPSLPADVEPAIKAAVASLEPAVAENALAKLAKLEHAKLVQLVTVPGLLPRLIEKIATEQHAKLTIVPPHRSVMVEQEGEMAAAQPTVKLQEPEVEVAKLHNWPWSLESNEKHEKIRDLSSAGKVRHDFLVELQHLGLAIGVKGATKKDIVSRTQCDIFVLDKEGMPDGCSNPELRLILLLGIDSQVSAAATEIQNILGRRIHYQRRCTDSSWMPPLPPGPTPAPPPPPPQPPSSSLTGPPLAPGPHMYYGALVPAMPAMVGAVNAFEQTIMMLKNEIEGLTKERAAHAHGEQEALLQVEKQEALLIQERAKFEATIRLAREEAERAQSATRAAIAQHVAQLRQNTAAIDGWVEKLNITNVKLDELAQANATLTTQVATLTTQVEEASLSKARLESDLAKATKELSAAKEQQEKGAAALQAWIKLAPSEMVSLVTTVPAPQPEQLSEAASPSPPEPQRPSRPTLVHHMETLLQESGADAEPKRLTTLGTTLRQSHRAEMDAVKSNGGFIQWLKQWPDKFMLHNLGNPGFEAVSLRSMEPAVPLTQSNLLALRFPSGEQDDNTSSGQTDPDAAESVATSAVTLIPSTHATKRLNERDVNFRLLQEAKKHHGWESQSWEESPRDGDDRWKITYNGVTMITDVERRFVITVIRDSSYPVAETSES